MFKKSLFFACMISTLIGQQVEAANVQFSGTVGFESGADFPGVAVTDAYNASINFAFAAASSVPVSLSGLTIGSHIYSITTGSIGFVDGGAGLDRLELSLGLVESGISAGTFLATVNATSGTLAGTDVTQTNLDAFLASAQAGSFFWTTANPGGTFITGTAAVPEPSSVFAMGAIGLCLVGGAWRKRKQQAVAAE